MTNERQIGGIPLEAIATEDKAGLTAIGGKVFENVPTEPVKDLDDYTIKDPITGKSVINPNSEQANSRDADGDPITDGGM